MRIYVKAFYQTVLGYTLQPLTLPESGKHPDMEMWAFPVLDGAPGSTGALVHMPDRPSGGAGNRVLIYFHSEDCAQPAGRVTAAGGAIHQEKTSIAPYGFIALATDTEGNRFGLHSMK